MADDLVLDLGPTLLRILGVLLEKERTVPGSYPMTLKGLVSGCNQTSGRDPIMALDDSAAAEGLDELRARGLTRVIHASHGARVVKYRQVLDEQLALEDDDRALLTVLILRGPQTPGELRSRSERMHPFETAAEVESGLAALAGREVPLVHELERRAGQKERRWMHLLGGAVSAEPLVPEAPGPGGDPSEVVLAHGVDARNEAVRTSYDAVAATYADELGNELAAKPFDRWLLERVAELADGEPMADVGCGPGQTTFHLAAAGASVTGFDLSPAMVAEASRRYPELTFQVADLSEPGGLPAPAGAPAGWAAVTGWYSMVHMAGSELAPAVGALAASLRPGGWLALALHVGLEVRPVQEWWGHTVELTFVLHDPNVVRDAVAGAGLVDVEWYRRSPLEGAEVATERIYVLARRPGAVTRAGPSVPTTW